MEEDRPVSVTVEDTTDGSRRTTEVGTWRQLWTRGISIGSHRDCTVVVESEAVRPNHARVYGRGGHVVAEAIEGPIRAGGREVETGQYVRINGLGPPVAPVGIGGFTISIDVLEPPSKELPRPWWKFW